MLPFQRGRAYLLTGPILFVHAHNFRQMFHQPVILLSNLCARNNQVNEFLGKGGFGEVRVGEHQLTGERVALKFLRKSAIADMGAAERTTTEIQCEESC